MNRNSQRALTERPLLVNNFLKEVFKMQNENITRLIIP
jgi:hypothetical protein